ncbi:uncharacterized protein BDZ99DRAFT_293556 [Mytilinidion resinicola]|uniref:Uncharacterized protein n=1 Tax=Mytilinidion resinicola TaxID=574789 RepID=A0A6A6YSK1_9PEZI|nr:uncharacterized protein BDZ99DRAFT_293556 [Mytilinidion resinicola]KAF2811024.1 hypothetical protein BDZ99DRAFT_293556 [Mytilinidion resinicola]
MVDYRHLEDPQSPPPSYHARWDELPAEDVKNEDSKEPEANVWVQRFQLVRQRTMPMVEKVHPYLKKDFLPTVKKMRLSKKQCCAFFLLAVFAVLPCVLMFSLDTGSDPSSPSGPFGAKTLLCGQLIYGYDDYKNNSTVKGIQGLFIVDAAYGNMSFSLVKFIDILWDLFVGRGVQFLAWYVSYVVFTDALLRVIERHPAPFRTFTHLTLEGASLSSMGALVRDMKRYPSRRTKWLFVYIILSTGYVLSLPTILGAMTGYVSTSKAFVTMQDDDSSQMVPLADFTYGFQVFDAYKLGQPNGSCMAQSIFNTYDNLVNAQLADCDCKLPNGTIVPAETNYYGYDTGNGYSYGTQCTFNYTNNTQEFTYPHYDRSYYYDPTYGYNNNGQNYSCNYLYNITLNGHNYKFDHLDLASATCYNGTAYDDEYLSKNAQCMPDTTVNTYQWGFSTMLSAVFVIVQLIWASSMYAVWQDAQWNSALVRAGYKMTQLRAVFSLSEAAQQRTGMENEELMRMESKRLEENLYGRKTLVDYGMWERKKLPFMREDEASSSRS